VGMSADDALPSDPLPSDALPSGPLPSADRRPPMSDGRFRALIAVAVAVAVVAIVIGGRATQTGSQDPARTPDIVERLIPGAGDEVLQQFEVGIDLAPGYEGALTINGVAIPTGELRIVRAQNEVHFQPGEGKVITELLAGPNCAVATVWKSALGRGADDQTFRWCFEAA